MSWVKFDTNGKMLSWASYLFGGSSSSEPQQNESNKGETDSPMDTTASSEKDWVVIEHADCCFGTKPMDHKSYVTCYPGNSSHGDTTDSASARQAASEQVLQKSDSSSSSPSKHSTPGSLSPVSHSRHLFVCTNHGRSNEAWLLTPPSCFTTGDNEAPQVGISDLENLLIEHPSMSVYKRSGSAGEESNMSDSSDEQVTSKRSQAVSRQAPKRVRTVSARAQVLAQVSQVKHAQKVQQKQAARSSGRRTLSRANKVATLEKNVSKKNRLRNPSGRMNGRMPQRKF